MKTDGDRWKVLPRDKENFESRVHKLEKRERVARLNARGRTVERASSNCTVRSLAAASTSW